MKLELKKIGNSTGVILPKELLARLSLQQGDWLYVSEVPGGGVKLSVADPEFEQAMEVARRGMRKYQKALRELAK
jgi:putative addiction module antidote